jgi:hypothetical protein
LVFSKPSSLSSSKIEREILGLRKNLFWEHVPGIKVTLISKFRSIWSTIVQESSFERKERILGRKISSRDLLLDFVQPYRTLSENLIHGFGHIFLTGCPIDPILFLLRSYIGGDHFYAVGWYVHHLLVVFYL